MPISQQHVTFELYARDMHQSIQQMFMGVDYSMVYLIFMQ